MPAALPIREELDPHELRVRARRDGPADPEVERGPNPARRVRRYSAQGVEGLRDRPKPGRPCGLAEGQQAAFKALILKGLDPARDGLSAWRIRDPCDLAAMRFGRRSSATGMLRRVPRLNLSWQQARPINRGPHPG